MLTRKLGRKKAHRTHMLRNLAASVILHEQVETTEAKAKEIKRFIESSITTAKKKSLAARRQLVGQFFDDAVVDKLMTDLATRFADRQGGYTRALRLGVRHGDGAETYLVSLLPAPKAETPNPAKAKAKVESKPAEVPVETQETNHAN